MHVFLPILLLLVLVLLIAWLAWWSLSLKLANDQGTLTGVGQGTRFFLVLLRLAIGWHFLVEGLDKMKSGSWSAEAYLRESSGPLAPRFRGLAGDPLRDRLTLGPKAPEALSLVGGTTIGLLAAPSPYQQVCTTMAAGYLPGKMPNVFPAKLEAEWQALFLQFANHHRLDAFQYFEARDRLTKAKGDTLQWLVSRTKEVQMPSNQPPPLKLPLTVTQRIHVYQGLEEKAQQIEQELPHYGSEAWTRLRTVKADISRIRGELSKDLAEQTGNMKKAISQVLSSEQKEINPPRFPARPPIRYWSLLEWSDVVVQYGLVLVGLCLLLGVLTRVACVTGAVYLLLFFLAMPPLPAWPENPRAEGHYLYLNKNIIEMLALLVLATTRSGRWLGLDGLLGIGCWVLGIGCRVSGVGTVVPTPDTRNPTKETKHGS